MNESIQQTQMVSTKARVQKIKAPGRIEKFAHLKDITEMKRHFYSGFQVNVINSLSKKGNFYLNSSLHLGKEDMMSEDDERASFSLGSTYVTKNVVLTGSMSTSGISQAIFHYNTPSWGANIHAQIADHEKWVVEASLVKNFSDFSTELKLGSREVGLAFTQGITPDLKFGSEFIWVFPDKLRLVELLQYQKEGTKLTGVFNWGTDRRKFNVYYSKKMKNLEFLTSYTLTQKRDNVSTVGLVGYNSRTMSTNAKGMIDTTGTVGSIVEVAVGPLFSISISTHVNYVHDIYETGFGITTGW
eukprot:TRINITY_DN1459_c0_g1_i2.p2 TRINITY_DN1459_c0_g1~~TRINITY_DN1459_c0_g1_i2.p2  ORF type:complete len:300 (+),score=53.21 TRINITY_DN1459_c0_g1_i2:50-949(+)